LSIVRATRGQRRREESGDRHNRRYDDQRDVDRPIHDWRDIQAEKQCRHDQQRRDSRERPGGKPRVARTQVASDTVGLPGLHRTGRHVAQHLPAPLANATAEMPSFVAKQVTKPIRNREAVPARAQLT